MDKEFKFKIGDLVKYNHNNMDGISTVKACVITKNLDKIIIHEDESGVIFAAHEDYLILVEEEFYIKLTFHEIKHLECVIQYYYMSPLHGYNGDIIEKFKKAYEKVNNFSSEKCELSNAEKIAAIKYKLTEKIYEIDSSQQISPSIQAKKDAYEEIQSMIT